MRFRAILIVAVLCASLCAVAATPGSSVKANILIVKSHQDIANWVQLDPAKRQGDVGRLRTVGRGVKIYLPVVATFSESQVGRTIAYKGYVQIVSPAGNTLAGMRLFANQVDRRAPATIVLEPVMDVGFDRSDPNGAYKVRARVTNGNETFTAEETFRLQ